MSFCILIRNPRTGDLSNDIYPVDVEKAQVAVKYLRDSYLKECDFWLLDTTTMTAQQIEEQA